MLSMITPVVPVLPALGAHHSLLFFFFAHPHVWARCQEKQSHTAEKESKTKWSYHGAHQSTSTGAVLPFAVYFFLLLMSDSPLMRNFFHPIRKSHKDNVNVIRRST